MPTDTSSLPDGTNTLNRSFYFKWKHFNDQFHLPVWILLKNFTQMSKCVEDLANECWHYNLEVKLNM